MRKEICMDCSGSGSQSYCKVHNSEPGEVCDCFSCEKCQGHGKLRVKVSEDQLNLLTLKVNQILFENGIDVKYNEDNNCMRSHLYDFLTEWCDYEIDKRAVSCHVSWIDLRKKHKISDPFK